MREFTIIRKDHLKIIVNNIKSWGLIDNQSKFWVKIKRNHYNKLLM